MKRPPRDTSRRELGQVQWGRDMAAAQGESRSTRRPLFVLFQEVPGCATCQGFGNGPLSHPLLVEAIETEFHPVLVYNNRGGPDQAVREAYSEPAWNNPVVRFLDASGGDVVPRRDGVWSTADVAARMIEALTAAHRTVPPYLRLVAEEERRVATESATFAMSCYWEGAAKLGGIPGVRSVRAGFLDGHEVVETTFDPRVIDFGSLVRQAKERGQAGVVFVEGRAQLESARKIVGTAAREKGGEVRTASETDQLYYLRHSKFNGLPLTSLQQVRVNAAMGDGTDPTRWLSPRQRAGLLAPESAAGQTSR
ncbi:MAG: VPGUxxT family thioredoxin-like (seleno)protein, type 2 [Candidatus Eisenbacteria bacterium]